MGAAPAELWASGAATGQLATVAGSSMRLVQRPAALPSSLGSMGSGEGPVAAEVWQRGVQRRVGQQQQLLEEAKSSPSRELLRGRGSEGWLGSRGAAVRRRGIGPAPLRRHRHRSSSRSSGVRGKGNQRRSSSRTVLRRVQRAKAEWWCLASMTPAYTAYQQPCESCRGPADSNTTTLVVMSAVL